MQTHRSTVSLPLMTECPRTVVVVPCYNEVKRLHVEDFLQFTRVSAGIQLLFVNDGSSDSTADVLNHVANASDRIGVVHLPVNGGKAEAVRQGILHAVAAGADYVGFWDADLATPLESILEFRRVLDHRADIDLVVGTRLPLLGRSIDRKPLRRCLGRVFAIIASSLLRLKVYDTQCGAKLFRATPEVVALFREPFLARWVFDVELLARWRRMRQNTDDNRRVSESVYELVLEHWKDVDASRLKRSDFLMALRDLGRIHFKYLRANAVPHPTLPSDAPLSQPDSLVSDRRNSKAA